MIMVGLKLQNFMTDKPLSSYVIAVKLLSSKCVPYKPSLLFPIIYYIY